MPGVGVIGGRKDVFEPPGRPAIFGMGQHIEDATGEVHDPKTVLESLVSRGRVNKPRQRELMNVAKSLERTGVDDSPFV